VNLINIVSTGRDWARKLKHRPLAGSQGRELPDLLLLIAGSALAAGGFAGNSYDAAWPSPNALPVDKGPLVCGKRICGDGIFQSFLPKTTDGLTVQDFNGDNLTDIAVGISVAMIWFFSRTTGRASTK